MENLTSNEAALEAIEEDRTFLIELINAKMDALRELILSGEPLQDDSGDIPREREYPLSSMPALFKGTKPTALIIGGERTAVRTWKTVYTEVLKNCSADEDCHARLMDLRGMIYGRKRPIVADNPNNMDVPVMISDGLYVETKYDTEQLMYILTSRILDAAGYDYRGISVAVIPGKGYRR